MSSDRLHRFFGSLRFRLTLSYAVAFGASLSIVFALMFIHVRGTAVGQTDAFLRSEALRLLDLAARRKPRIMQAEIDRFVEHHGSENVFISLCSSQGVTLASSDAEGWSADARAETMPHTADLPLYSDQKAQDGRRIRTIRMKSAAGHGIRISRDLSGFDKDVRLAGFLLFFAFAGSLSVGTVLAFVLVAKAFDRIKKVRQTAAAIAGGDLSRRIPAGGRGDEIEALAETFNHMIERIESVIGELRSLTDSMAHDFRTPLTRMRGAAENLLLDGAASPAESGVLALVVEECDRLQGMISTMLQIVRMDAGSSKPEPQPVELATVARHAVELLEPAFEDKGVALTLKVPPGALHAMVDRLLFERVLANLLDNALKFTPAGGTVEVSVERQRDGSGFTVADTGIGIAEEDLPRIFDRFYRADASRSAGGFGLGLSFVKSAVQSQGGRVSVVSAPGRGSTFTVWLPSPDRA